LCYSAVGVEIAAEAGVEIIRYTINTKEIINTKETVVTTIDEPLIIILLPVRTTKTCQISNQGMQTGLPTENPTT
jgi:hypothetical protein